MFGFPENKNKRGAYLLFDIGGTKMRVAVSRDGETIEEPKILPTPYDFKEGMGFFEKLAEDALSGAPARAVCGGLAGIFSEEYSKIFRAPHLPGWDGAPIKSELEKMFGAHVFIENDSALAGLGEAVRGAGRGSNIVSYFTVSTGVGGARIVHGQIDYRVYGFEPGHQIVNGIKGGDLESYVSGSGILKKYGKNPAEITDQKIMDDLVEILSVGLYNSILHWSPETIVLGGALILGQKPVPYEKVEEKLRQMLTVFPKIPVIRKAELGDLSGLYGALEYTKQNEN